MKQIVADLYKKMLVEIQNNGVTIEYYPATLCPCFNPSKGVGDSYCPVCAGIFYVWPAAPTFTGLALISSRDSQINRADPGEWETGVANCTFPQGLVPADWDKVIVVKDTAVINNEALIVGDKYRGGSSREKLRFSRIVKIETIQSLNGAALVQYVIGTDVNITNGLVSWINKPADGTVYSVRYQVVPEYLVRKNVPHLRADSDQQFPFFGRIERLDKLKQ